MIYIYIYYKNNSFYFSIVTSMNNINIFKSCYVYEK